MASKASPRPGLRRRSPLDPRIRDRRVSVQREVGRRRLRLLLTAVIVVAILAAAGGLLVSPLLDVNEVVVTGVSSEQAATVRARASISRGDPILLTKTGDAEQAIESLPWVAEAEVGRELPGTIRISVTPRALVAWVVRNDGQAALVDQRGIVVRTSVAPPAGLPQLRGEVAVLSPPSGAPSRALELGARVAAALPDTLEAVGVTVTEGEATVNLAASLGVGEIRVGDGHALADKMKAAVAVLGALGGRRAAYVDVRVPSAPTTGPATGAAS